MNIVEAVEIAQRLEELIFVTVNKIDSLRREDAVNGLARALVKATKKTSEDS